MKGLRYSREECGILCWRPVPSAAMMQQQEGGNVDSRKGTVWRDGLMVALGELSSARQALEGEGSGARHARHFAGIEG